MPKNKKPNRQSRKTINPLFSNRDTYLHRLWQLFASHSIGAVMRLEKKEKRKPYTGEELRAIRAKNGVGRPPGLFAARRQKIIAEAGGNV